MSQRMYKIRGTLADPRSTKAGGTAPRHRLFPGSARDGAGDQVEVAGDTVVRVELENGFVLWSRVDDMTREYGTAPPSRSMHKRRRGGAAHEADEEEDDAWEFSRLTPQRAANAERGILGLAIRVLDFFGVDVVEKPARSLAIRFEEKLLGKHPPGLYRIDLAAADFALQAVADNAVIPADQGPILIFLHGTASSTEGSFGKLWAATNNEGARLRQALAPNYGNRVFGLEHRTLSESPIENALALVNRLPDGAEIHLVSHSRGGLVGELLALSGCSKLAEVLNAERLQTLFAADRTLAPQLSLLPLSEAEAKARDAAYGDDRARLATLVGLLEKKQLRLTRFVRVACPARGTTLASGRLDRWLSVLDFLASAATGNGLFGDGIDFLVAVIKQRTDPRTMPGLEAMMPGSALTRLLNGTPELVSSADLSVIAGDIESGDGLWNAIKVLASDWFFRNDHDLVVDTGSMLGGLPRPDNLARQRLDQGPKVSHFRYFTNEQSVRWLKAGLARQDGDSAGFLALSASAAADPASGQRCSAAVVRSRSSGKPRPIVVVLPGTMGSKLRVDDDTVWLNYWSLLKGGLKRLTIDRDGIAPVGLVDQFYGPLVEFLARSHQVEIFPYDWRHSVRKAAARLVATLEPLVAQAERSGQPLRLVAHSMGGLVVRSMIADGGAGTALWQRITRLPGSRFLMLGTPNLGSYEAVRWLTGFNPTQSKLSLLDITQSTNDIIGLVGRYAGLLELLPFSPDDPDFAEPARWLKLRDEIGADWRTADADFLKEAAATWKLLRAAPADPRFMSYVAGCQPCTVVDYQIVNDRRWWIADRKQIEFIATSEGDGTVSWESGRLAGVPVWYVENTAHDELCAQAKAFAGYLDILVNGQTTLLPAAPPRTRAASAESRFVLPVAPPPDSIPGPEDMGSFGFSGSGPVAEDTGARPLPTIELAVRHGNLAYARHPVVVGHYQGDTVVSAEAVLDKQLGGALTRRLDLGIYPGPLGSNTVFLNDSPIAKPGGGIVVGLGQVGGLSPGLLEESVRSALLEFALKAAHWPDRRFGDDGRPRSAAVTCLLVGTGAGGLPVGDALEAILRAAVSVNRRLAARELDSKVLIDRLEFLELYEDVAIAAADALTRVLQNQKLAAAVRWPVGAVETAQAGRRRVRFAYTPEWYQRLEIIEDAGRLRFVFPTDRARAEETIATGQIALADSFVRIASRDTGQNSDAAKTLFEMLLPLRLRELAQQQGNLIVMVDRRSARHPWELLENRWASGERPPAVAAGFIRQFRTVEFRQQPVHGLGNTALVIGNPDLAKSPDFCDLPGAREEARQVADQLASAGYEVTDCIDQPATPIMEAMHKDSWRILHLAGHGVHEHRPGGDPSGRDKVSGMVIGADSFLTSGDIAQMRFVPELVFVNCCHLGRVDGERDFDRLGLAANLGEEFIRMGVRAVIASGWAVDDRAAQAFAATFYRGMLAGEAFGEAVRVAREDIWSRFPEVNTWGAYQCYGDPDFRFHRDGVVASARAPTFGTANELVAELENLSADLRATGGLNGAERIGRRLARIPPTQADSWLKRGDVCAALGLLWGEIRNWEEAIRWLEKGLVAEKGECSMRALERYANYRVRLAVDTWRQAGRQPLAKRKLIRATQIGQIESAILDLDTLCRRAPTVDRLCLLGGAYKRLAELEEEGGPRLEALVNMAHHFRLAFERKRDAYPFTNWAAACALIAQRRDSQEATNQDSLLKEIDALQRDVARCNAENPDFWNGVKLSDLALIRLLLKGATPPAEGAGTTGNTGGDAAEAQGAFRNAIGCAASPREVASLSDNLCFLMDLWPPADKPLLRVLEQIRESLQ